MVQMKTLVKIAVCGAVATVGTGIYLQQLLQERVRYSKVFQEAVMHLRHNDSALSILGEPIKIGSVDATNRENYCYSDKAHLQVPLKGSKTKGILEFWAEKNKQDDVWEFSGIEVEITDKQGGKFSILRPQVTN